MATEASYWLHAGAAVQGFMLPYNLGRFGNGIALWLGIQPYGKIQSVTRLSLLVILVSWWMYRE